MEDHLTDASSSQRKSDVAQEALKRQMKSEIKAELKLELMAEVREELKASYWIQRDEMVEVLHQLCDSLCSELDQSSRPKVERCFGKLRAMMGLEADEAVEYINNWRRENEDSRMEKALTDLEVQLLDREKRSKDRWLERMHFLKHYVVEVESKEQKFAFLDDLLSRFKDHKVIVFMKANQEIEDLCCSVNRNERYIMIEYLLPGLKRKNSVASVMGGNLRVCFSKNDTAYGYHSNPGDPLVIINYDFYTRTRTYLHRLRLAGFNGYKKGIIINLVELDELQYLANLEGHYEIVMEPLPDEINLSEED